MKRYAAQIGLTSFSVLAAAFYLPDFVTRILLISAAAASLIFLLVPKIRKTIFLPLIALTVAVSCGVNLAYTAMAVNPVIDRFCGEKKQIEATLTDESYRQYSKYCYPLRVDSVDGETAGTKLLLKTGKPLDMEPFDTVSFTADIEPVSKNADRAKGYYIAVNAVALDYSVEAGENHPLYAHVIGIRQAMRDALDDFLPQAEANLCKAVLIGDKAALDQTVKEDFRYSGASYLIVVSGMHFSIICLSLYFLFRRLFRRRFWYITFPVTYLIIFLYMLINGFQPSVMRSGVMMLILVTGQLIRRQTDSLTSLGIAAICMPFIFSPYGCGDICMILSFTATFSIIMWHPPLYRKLCLKRVGKNPLTRRLIKGVNGGLSLICVSLSANILVLPLSVFIFNGFSTVFLLSALLLYPLILLTLIFAPAVCIFYYLGPLRYLALLFSWPLYAVTWLALFLVRAISSIPFAYIHIRSFWIYLWVGITLLTGLIAWAFRKSLRLYQPVILLSAILFLTGITVNTVVQLHTDVLNICAGEKGAAVYLNRHGHVYLLRFDCDSASAYKMLYRLTDDYGGADFGVCTVYTERVNYARMSEREFPLTNYLEYRDVPAVFDPREPDEIFDGDSDFTFDEGVTLYTVEDDGKELLYLLDGDKSLMLIPTGFSYDAIPADMRYADIIIINKGLKDYQKLSCDTLYYSGDSSKLNNRYFPEHQTLYDATDEQIMLNMKDYD